MGDTKRGRERAGRKKREQLREQEIAATLEADEEPPEPKREEPDVRETELDFVSVTPAHDRDT